MIHIVLPAYNEEEGIGELLESVKEAADAFDWKYRVIVADDGSSDRTAEIVRSFADRLPAVLVSHDENQGLGAAVRTCFRKALEEADDRDLVVLLDGDNSHPPGLIASMIPEIYRGFDVVIASRYRSGARVMGVSVFRRIMSWGAGMLFRIVHRLKGVKDYTCGYRAYRVPVLRAAIEKYGGEAFPRSNGFDCMVEILLKLNGMGVLFSEVPLVLRYDMKQSSSKMNILVTIKKNLKLILGTK